MLAGLFDAGLASLATFAVGIYAVRTLDPTILGAYALVYQAIFLVGIVPANLVFVPVEIAVVADPVVDRLDHLRRSLVLGAAPAVLSGLATAAWVLVAPPEAPRGPVVALTLTGIGTAILSPVQDHVRRMLHSGGRSWSAAWVSSFQLAIAVAALLALRALAVPHAWIPFGALGLANLVSLLVGIARAEAGRRGRQSGAPLRFRELVRSGRWLLGGGLLQPATGFAAAAIVSRLAGAAALGFAEAARVVAQPVWVLAVGLSSVLGPRSMEAARRRRRTEARRIARTFLLAVLIVGGMTLLWLGIEWRFNPLAWLLPAAYVVNGLVAASIVAQVVAATTFPFRSEVLGAREESAYTRIEGVASFTRVIVSATAPVTRAFAIPLGLAGVGLVRWVGFRRLLSRFYAVPVSASEDEPA